MYYIYDLYQNQNVIIVGKILYTNQNNPDLPHSACLFGCIFVEAQKRLPSKQL